MGPNFGHHARFTHFVDAVAILRKKETDSPFTSVAKLFFTCKNLYFVNDEVWAGCPKLRHATSKVLSFIHFKLYHKRSTALRNHCAIVY